LKKVISLLYGVQIYSVAVTLITTPILLMILGVEGYGLIGLFFVIQMLLQVVDGGLTGSITKLAAKLDPLDDDSIKEFNVSYFYLKKILNKIVLTLLFLGLLLHQSHLLPLLIQSSLVDSTINNSIFLMIACIAIRFLSLIDRGLLQGLERQKFLAITNLVSTTLRYPFAILVLALFGKDITLFFCIQVLVATIEVSLLKRFSHSNVQKLGISLDQKLSSVKTFLDRKWLIEHAGGQWLFSVLWILASQLDKLVLSFSVSLEDFGSFSLALVCANTMITMFIPVNQILMPRFVKLNGYSDRSPFTNLIFKSIQFYICFFSVATGALIFFGNEILFLWTRNNEISTSTGVILGYLAFGNLVHGVTMIVFILAFARNELMGFAKRYAVHVAIFLPISTYSALVYKEYGIALTWVVSAVLFFLHTSIPFLLRVFSARMLMFTLFTAAFQIILVITLMYFFRCFFSVKVDPPLTFMLSLGCFFSLLVIINYLIIEASKIYYGYLFSSKVLNGIK